MPSGRKVLVAKARSQSPGFAPSADGHDLTAKGFGRILTVVMRAHSQGECRLFARFLSVPISDPSSSDRIATALLQHIGNHKVLEDDQVFLHWQERVLECSGGRTAAQRSFFLPTTSDVYVTALYSWLDANGGEPFPDSPLPHQVWMFDGSLPQPHHPLQELLVALSDQADPTLGLGLYGVLPC